MASIRSNKENIVTFRTPLAGEKQSSSRLSTKKQSVIKNKDASSTAFTPARARVPFGGKDTNVKKAPATLKKPALGSSTSPLKSAYKLSQTPSLKQKPAFTIQEDKPTAPVASEPVSDVFAEDGLPAIEFFPEPLVDSRNLNDDDDLGLDLDFAFIKESLSTPLFLMSDGALDRPLVFRDEQVPSQRLPPPSQKKPTKLKTLSPNVATPRFMAPTASASKKRIARSTYLPSHGSKNSSSSVFKDYEVTTDELLSQLEDSY